MADLAAMGETPVPNAGDMIMHAALKSPGSLLMGSDDPTTESFGPGQGMQVNYTATEVDDAQRVFAALSEDGEVVAPTGPTSWSPMFGVCVDRFGTPWMIDTEAPADAS